MSYTGVNRAKYINLLATSALTRWLGVQASDLEPREPGSRALPVELTPNDRLQAVEEAGLHLGVPHLDELPVLRQDGREPRSVGDRVAAIFHCSSSVGLVLPVSKAGVEPARPGGHQLLGLARLPVPALGR